MLSMGRRHAQKMIEIKKKTVPITTGVCPPIKRIASAIAAPAIVKMITRLFSCQSFRIKLNTTSPFMPSPPRDCVQRLQQKSLRASCFPPHARAHPNFHKHSEDGARMRLQLPRPTVPSAESRSRREARADQLRWALPAVDAASDRDKSLCPSNR